MKRLLLTTGLLLVVAFTALASERKLVILFTDGSQAMFMLSDNPSMTFANHTMRLSAAGSNNDYELADVLRFYFTDSSEIGIMPAQNEKDFMITIQGNDKLIIDHHAKSVKVLIHDIGGKNYNAHAFTVGGRTEVQLSSLAKGIYLISINNKTIKIHRK